MEPNEQSLNDLAGAILEGATIDWLAVEGDSPPADKRVIRQLRVLADLANLHRSLPLPGSADAPWPLHLGGDADLHRWGHLVLHERVGAGAFGQVYRAWDTRLDREVALKILRGDSVAAGLDSTVIAEGRLLARIRHPNVVTVYGAERLDGRVGIWTEFVHGRTLEQELHEGGPFSATEAATVGIEICRALAAIHAAGLLHRDIKAQNVMREAGGRVVLMDLGAGTERLLEESASTRDVAGTPLYVAPEILDGAAASPQSDIYSLGVLLYRLVSGAFPVHAASLDEVRAAYRANRRTPLAAAYPDLPHTFITAIDTAINPAREHRYASADAFETALRAVVTPADELVGVRSWKRTTAWMLVAGTVVAAAAAAIALGPVRALYRNGRTTAPAAAAAADTRQPTIRRVPAPAMGLFRAGAPSYDGRLYSNTDTDENLIVFDVDSGRPTQLTEVGNSGEMAQWSVLSPDGRSVVYLWEMGDQFELRAINADGTGKRVLVPASSTLLRPIEWSRDGASVLALADRSGTTEAVLIDATSGSRRVVAEFSGFSPQHVSLSPDNGFITFDSPGPGSQRDISVISTRGGAASTLVAHPADDSSPVWTPDGRHVFFVSNRTGSSVDGWIVPVVNGTPQGEPIMIARNVGRIAVAGFTRTGALYYWLQTGDMDVFTAALDRRETPAPPTRLLSQSAGANSGPAWSPDGRSFAYVSQHPEMTAEPKAVIVIRDEASGSARELTPPLRRLAPVPLRWSPDGRTLLLRGGDAHGKVGAWLLDVASSRLDPAVVVDQAHASDVGQVRWWNDSRTIAYLSPRGLVVRDLRTGNERIAFDGAAASPRVRLNSFDLAPDGRSFAFSGTLVDSAELVVATAPLDGTSYAVVARAKSPEQMVLQSWLPGGSALLVTRWQGGPGGTHELWRLSVDDGATRDTGVRINGFTQINLVQVNPSATHVAYTANQASWELWVMENFLPDQAR